ncbi:PEGA domain-containing protein [Pyxidicoccus xibeiensis]|uniref:PEGA domain-containing protein n=1 Tax=Pyxidicoccus xibeiensis TaxID=2906759 RepID=UPI0020A828D5|nr:PEGA domain-containing protein [Pyxidicoccus xibeiensis]MCP3139302.1 PEGA domain-containing protein [Pyxidicoccus xibeiensis]
MKQKTWIAVILLGTVAVNAVAYLAVRSRRAAEAPFAAGAEPARAAPATVASVSPPPAPAAVEPAREDANEGLARARRAAGLAALEDREYDTAVSEFTEALRLRGDDKGDLVELLRIAVDLQTREQARAARAERSKPSRETAATSRAAKTRAARLAARTQPKEKEKEAAPAEVEESRGALLLVTSTPPGLTVLVDGKAVDLTPARVPMRVGTYRVAIAQGGRKLAEETVELAEDDVHSINRDLTADVAPPPARAAPAPMAAALPSPAAASPVSAQQPAAARAVPATAPASPEPPPPATARTAPTSVASAAVAQKGDLDVSSPSLYGEVWINNRPYGFPPIKAQGLPAGTARVEVRVNGVVKRKMNVEVEPGRLTAVRVR